MTLSRTARAAISRVAAWLAWAFGLLACALAALAWWRGGLSYGEQGQHFEDGVTVHEQAVLAWAVLALGALSIALVLVVVHRQTRDPR